MKIVIVDDDESFLSDMPTSGNRVCVETLHVSWEEIAATHNSAFDAAKDILSREPDVIFLDHTLGYKPAGQWRGPETGKDVARELRSLGFGCRLISISSEKQPYCDAYCGKRKMLDMSLSALVEYVTALTAECKA